MLAGEGRPEPSVCNDGIKNSVRTRSSRPDNGDSAKKNEPPRLDSSHPDDGDPDKRNEPLGLDQTFAAALLQISDSRSERKKQIDSLKKLVSGTSAHTDISALAPNTFATKNEADFEENYLTNRQAVSGLHQRFTASDKNPTRSEDDQPFFENFETFGEIRITHPNHQAERRRPNSSFNGHPEEDMEILTANQSLAHTPAPGLRHRTRAQPVNNDLPTTDNEEITQSTVTHQSLSGKTSAFSNHLIFVQTFLLVFAFRLFNVLMIRTFWQPDEYWQSLEVAHEVAFGYGHLTWEWAYKIRGFAHPSIFVACYRFLHFLGLDDTEWLILGPKILQAFFASLTDCYTFMVASRYFGVGPARWSLISSLLSWFNFFCGVRTFSNTLETMFTVIALYYWPLPESNPNNQISYRDFRCALVIAVVGCLMRPTNALIWVFNGVQLAIRSRHTPRILVQITIDVVLVTVLAISGSVVIDHLFYGEIVLVPYNFVMSNIFSNIAVFYGTHPWHWYISQGVPVVLFSYLPVIFWIAHLDFRSAGRLSHSSSNIQPPSTALQRRKYMYSLLAWIISIYSMLGHKEFRFIYPIVPIGCILVGCALNKIAVAEKALRQINDAADPSTGDCQTLFRTVKRWFSPTRLKMVVFFLWITNTLAAYYLGMVHQRGVLDAVQWLRERARTSGFDTYVPADRFKNFETLTTLIPPLNTILKEFYRYPHATNDHPGTAMDGILFLMPCHSTPYYSHIHRNIPMRFLSCEPPLGVDDRSKYLDESDIFYNDPISFIQTYFDGASLRTMNERRSSDSEPLLTVPGQTYSIRRCRWPSHVVLFDALLPRVEDLRLFRTSTNDQPGSFVYTECARFFNSHFHDDSRRMGDVIIFCKNVNALG